MIVENEKTLVQGDIDSLSVHKRDMGASTFSYNEGKRIFARKTRIWINAQLTFGFGRHLQPLTCSIRIE